jgi:hypothetical protein
VNKDGETRAFYDIAVVTFPPTHALPPSLPFPLRAPYRTNVCAAASRFTHPLPYECTALPRRNGPSTQASVRCRSLSRRAKGRSRSWSCTRRPFSSRCRTVSQLNHLGSPVP